MRTSNFDTSVSSFVSLLFLVSFALSLSLSLAISFASLAKDVKKLTLSHIPL